MFISKRVKYDTEREEVLDEEYTTEVEAIINLTKDANFVGKKIGEHNKYIKRVVENPFEEYQKLNTRLKLYGKDTSFPEFEGVIISLMKDIINTDTTNNSLLSVLKEQTIIKLASLFFRVFLPYRQTIVTISDSLFFFDLIQRTSVENVNKSPFFHTRRYYYYQNMLLSENCVLFPSIYGIGSTDLIKVRCVPIFFVGVTSKQVFVDEYINTSVEFYFHDIQHARRMLYYNQHYYDTKYKHMNYGVSRSSYDYKQIEDMYEEASEFTKNSVLPLLTIENQYHERLTDENNAILKINKMIIFEIVHEGAFFVAKDLIIEKILEKDCKTPVESICRGNNMYPTVINTMYDDPPMLSNLMYKLQSSFYDTADDRHEYIVPVNYRYSKYAVIGAQRILNQLCQDTIDYTEELQCLVKSEEKRPEPPKGYSIIEQ